MQKIGHEFSGKVGLIFHSLDNVEQDDGDVVDEPAVGTIIKVKKGDRPICIHKEITCLGILVDQTVGFSRFLEGIQMGFELQILFEDNLIRFRQPTSDIQHLRTIPLRPDPGRICGGVIIVRACILPITRPYFW